MPNRMVDVCPDCDVASLQRAGDGYYCAECGEYVETPDRREAKERRGDQHAGPGSALMQADPDDWP